MSDGRLPSVPSATPAPRGGKPSQICVPSYAFTDMIGSDTAAHELDGSDLYWAHRNKSRLGESEVDISATKGFGTTAPVGVAAGGGVDAVRRARTAGPQHSHHQPPTSPVSGTRAATAQSTAGARLPKSASLSSIPAEANGAKRSKVKSKIGTATNSSASARAQRSLFGKEDGSEPRLTAKSMVRDNSNLDDPSYSGGEFWGRPGVREPMPKAPWATNPGRPSFEPMPIPPRRTIAERDGGSQDDSGGWQAAQSSDPSAYDDTTPFQLMTPAQQRAFLMDTAEQQQMAASPDGLPRVGNGRSQAPASPSAGPEDSDSYEQPHREIPRGRPAVQSPGRRSPAPRSTSPLLMNVQPARSVLSQSRPTKKKRGRKQADAEEGDVPGTVMHAFKELMAGSAALFEATMSKVGHERATELEQAKIDHEAAQARWAREKEELVGAHQQDREATILSLNEKHEEEMENLRELMRKELAKSMRERRAALETQRMRFAEETARRAFERDELLKKQVEESDSRMARAKALHEREVRCSVGPANCRR